MSDTQDPDAIQVSNDWLEAAAFAGLYLKVVPLPTSRDLWPAHHNLMMMSRAQYATEASYERFQLVAEAEEANTENILQAYMELHLFLVSAHLCWMTLEELTKYLNVQEFEQALARYKHLAERTRVARNHMEHITERIGEGRRRGPDPMSADDFRRAMGVYDANAVTFGAERFDLGEIHEAVKSVGREVAPRLRELLDSAISSDVTPRLMALLRQSQAQGSDGENT